MIMGKLKISKANTFCIIILAIINVLILWHTQTFQGGPDLPVRLIFQKLIPYKRNDYVFLFQKLLIIIIIIIVVTYETEVLNF